MKEQYQNAEMDVVKFSVEDVIATSNNQGEPGGGWDILDPPLPTYTNPTFGTNPPGGELGTAW